MRKKIKDEKINPTVKEVLILLGVGFFITASILAPGLPLAIKPFIDYKKEKDYQKWKQFNQARLKQVLRRLKEQKVVEVISSEQGDIIKITEKGKRKVLNFNLENIQLEKKWDGKWRLIIYDVAKERKKERDFLREILKRLNCFQLQKSVYLTPYQCEDEIEYIRQLFGIGDEVKILKVASLENEKPYREYFGI